MLQAKWAALALGFGLALTTPAAAGELRAFGASSEIESYIENVAIAEMEKQVDRPPIMYRMLAGSAAGGTAAGSHSTTNVQTAGVDEPDFVKNDAGYVYKLVGESLVIVDASPAWYMRESSRVKIEGWPHAMFLLGDKVVVFSSAPAPRGMERPETPGPWWGGGIRTFMMPYHQTTQVVKATVLDVTRRTAPRVEREYYLEGRYVDARMVGPQMHLVTTSRTPGPELVYWQDWSRQPTAAESTALKTENRRRIRAATLADWMPRQLDKANARTPALAIRPTKCFRPATAEGRSILTVSTLDLATTAAPKHVALIAEAGEVYGSASALYVACYRYRYWSESGVGQQPGDTSEIHRFRVGLVDGPRYDGTGTVPGHVLNQFAMDEWNGMLRVATTTEATGAAGSVSQNHLFVLKHYPTLGRILWKLGEIRNIAPGERIYSTRFLGERGFIVTFKQVDPLFAIDMRRLKVMGELKIDGFSTYLHPVGTTHLLAVGNAVDPATNRVTGIDVSLFDVSNLAQPRLAFRRTLPGAYSSSLYDHHAFNFFNGKLMIPLNDWQNGFAGLEVYDVSLTRGISLAGRIDHGGMARALGWTNGPEVTRSAVIGTAILSISDVGIKASRVANPSLDYKELPIQP